MVTAVLLGTAVFLLVVRPLFRAPALAQVVATIGLVIVIMALIERRFPDNAGLRVDPILPREPVTISSDLTVPRDGLWLAAIVLAIAAACLDDRRGTPVSVSPLVRRRQSEKGAVLLGHSPVRLAGQSFVFAIARGVVRGRPRVTDDPTVAGAVHVRLPHPRAGGGTDRTVPPRVADGADRAGHRARAVQRSRRCRTTSVGSRSTVPAKVSRSS